MYRRAMRILLAVSCQVILGLPGATLYAEHASPPLLILIRLNGVIINVQPEPVSDLSQARNAGLIELSLPGKGDHALQVAPGSSPLLQPSSALPEPSTLPKKLHIALVKWAPLFIQSLVNESTRYNVKIAFFSSSPDYLNKAILKELYLPNRETSFLEAAEGRVLSGKSARLFAPEVLQQHLGLEQVEASHTIILDVHQRSRPYQMRPQVLWVRTKDLPVDDEALVRTRAILDMVIKDAPYEGSPLAALTKIQAKRCEALVGLDEDYFFDDEPQLDAGQYRESLDRSASLLRRGYIHLFEQSQSHRFELRVDSPHPRLSRQRQKTYRINSIEAPLLSNPLKRFPKWRRLLQRPLAPSVSVPRELPDTAKLIYAFP